MHALNDVATVVEHALDVLSVHGACKVRVAVVLAVATRRAYAKELVPYEVLGAAHFWVIAWIWQRIRRGAIARELSEVFLEP